VLSGGALKGLINYNQGMAKSAYTDAFNRWNSTNTNTYNRLSGLLQLGQNSAAGVGAQGVNLAGTQSNNILAGANASAAGTIGSANALSGGLSNAAGYYALANMGNNSGGTQTFSDPGSSAPIGQANYVNYMPMQGVEP
jgi:hypothetical protein